MKKNRFIKIAAVVFTLCLITTCGISTTLAKYTTGGNAQDSARVAKWGVQLTMEGDPIFHNEYATHDAGYAGALSVHSDVAVVAPGTNSTDVASSARFALTGTPEVAVQVVIDFEATKDVFLAAGVDYTDPTQARVEKEGNFTYKYFKLDTEYHPIVFTLKQVGDATGTPISVVLVEGTLAQIEAYLNGWSKNYAPNTVLDSEFELSWVWAFGGNEQADTLLGQLAAGVTEYSTAAANYSVEVAYSIGITVTQID